MTSTLFVSYAHEDEEWKKNVEAFLRILLVNSEAHLEIWSDTKLKSGDDWKATIEEKLEAAKIAILIVTKDFLISDFIMREELPVLLAREENQALRIIPLLARPCPWQEVPSIRRFQLKTAANGQALSAVPPGQWEEVLTELVAEVREILAPPQPPAVPQPPPQSQPQPWQQRLTLEVSLRHRRGEEYLVDLRYRDLDVPEDNRSLAYKARINIHDLKALQGEVENYARALERQVFPAGAPRAILDFYSQHLGQSGAKLRINVEATARDLHQVFWETLPLAHSQEPFSAASAQLFVRSVSAAGEGWSSPALCAWPDRLRVALFALAPDGIPDRGTLLEDYASALSRESLAYSMTAEPTDLTDLKLVEAKILLLCVYIGTGDQEPVIRFEDREHGAQAFTSDEFAQRIQDLANRPQVIILDSLGDQDDVKSGRTTEDALVLFASELVTTGVCAVVTRQAPMERSQWLRFLARFASELSRGGNVDSANAAACFALGLSDCWKPVVLTRLRTGQLWYQPMFPVDPVTAWTLLVKRIKSKGDCVPIIGPLVSQHVVRSRGDIAERWARKYDYPGAAEDRRELRKVAQFVATTLESRMVREEYAQNVVEYLNERYSTVQNLPSDESVMAVMEMVWDQELANRTDDPYNLLASLRLPLYLTTNLHNYLSLAFAGQTRADSPPPTHEARVRERIFSQKEHIYGSDEERDDRTFALDWNRPLIYHLFGRLDRPETMVLTEDDHFRFLLQFQGKWACLPSLIRKHISESALLFLGFDLGSWEFRSIFRALLEIAGSDVFHENTHVAVQIGMDEDTMTDPAAQQHYLREYFRQISRKPFLFLGSAQDFLKELRQRVG